MRPPFSPPVPLDVEEAFRFSGLFLSLLAFHSVSDVKPLPTLGCLGERVVQPFSANFCSISSPIGLRADSERGILPQGNPIVTFLF